jgi:glutamyl/glutaminyl-tRNA synthetase
MGIAGLPHALQPRIIGRPMQATNIVTRFAPSPTGYLHVGGARTALFNWLFSRHSGGRFLLRIEDTDLARSTEEATRQLLEDLRWLGLQWDNAELVYQSKRLPIYTRIIDDLLARGLAYKAYETSEELANQRKQAEQGKRQFRYRRPTLTEEQIRAYEAEGRPHVVRFAMPVKDYRFDDAVLGPNQGFGAGEVQDFVIRKSDGMPTYHFGVVIDDAESGVTHVLRGQEHLLNTCNHIALQEALGYARPIYAHLPVILAPETGEKLSKRDRDRKIRQRSHEWIRSQKKTGADLANAAQMPVDRLSEWLGNDKMQLDLSEQPKVMGVIGLKEADLPEIMVHDFRKTGYLPEVLNNFLALLGWSPGNDLEHMSMDDLVARFTLEGVGKSNAKFNREKLIAFNTEACEAASPQRLLAAFKDFLAANPQSPINSASDEQLSRLLQMKVGFRTLREVEGKSRFLFIADEKIEYDRDAMEKVLKKNGGQGADALRGVREVLSTIADWNTAGLETALNGYCESKGLVLGKVAQPIRVGISGSTISPPIFQTLEFLGKESTILRIDRCLGMLHRG